MSISETGWYLLSVSSNKSWTDAKTEWQISNYVIYRYIYELINSIPNGTSINAGDWDQIDTSANIDPTLSVNLGYFVYITEIP